VSSVAHVSQLVFVSLLAASWLLVHLRSLGVSLVSGEVPAHQKVAALLIPPAVPFLVPRRDLGVLWLFLAFAYGVAWLLVELA